MRFAFIDDYRPAVVTDRGVVDVSHVLDSIPKLEAQDLLEGLVQRFDEFRTLLEEAAATGEATPVDQVRFRPPVPRPGKMVCMAGNYLEGGTIPRAYDVDAFLKAPSSVVGDGDTVVLPNVPATVFNHEAELGVVIGKEMKNVDATMALDHVFGYLNFMDVSARGITPNGNNSFWWQKSWDTFGPIGPWIVTADEIANTQKLQIRLWNDGDLRHDFNTSDMARSVAEVLEWVSTESTLYPGDIVATGTNHLGLGPMQDGETVVLEVEGLGRLSVKVSDAYGRTWVRETVAEQEAREGGH